jgi:sugar/nucleoside kinase (ribokinase family)
MSATIVVAGVVSLYMSVSVREFPVRYESSARPLWAGSGMAGVAGHVARVQRALGNEVRLCTLVGRDTAGEAIRAELRRDGLDGPGVVASPSSSLGLVLVGPDGRRMGLPHLAPVNHAAYPYEVLREQARGADLLVLTNAKFVRPLVAPAAGLGVPIAVDVHLVSDPGGEYNRPWLERARIVFCSHERLPDPRAWVAELFRRYPRCRVAGVGLGARGAMVGLRDGRLIEVRAVPRRRVVNTSGAGDALFATFLDGWLRHGDAVTALRDGVLHASWKIGHRTPAAVSLTGARLAELRARTPPPVVEGRWDRRAA